MSFFKLKALIGTICVILVFSEISFAQTDAVTINQLTGTANVTVPLYTFNIGKLTMPMSIDYSATGIKPTDVEGSAGVGWNLNAGGAITRQVRGLPDDCQQDIAGNSRLGWLYNSNGVNISNFNIVNDNNSSTYTDAAQDISYINTHFSNFSDTEPDVFQVNAPGLNCQLIFDNNHNVRTVPYEDVIVTYTTNSAGAISSFSIINDEGIKYIFSATEQSYQKAVSDAGSSTNIIYFKTQYNLYQNGINYTSAWNLTSMTDIYNNSIVISYVPGLKKVTKSGVQLALNAANSPTSYYTVYNGVTPNVLSQVAYSDNNGTEPIFNFSYAHNDLTGKNYINQIYGLGHYLNFAYTNIGTSTFNRNFLKGISDQDCSSPFKFAFDYNAAETLPDSTSMQIDYWGYFNNAQGNTSLRPTVDINPSATAVYDRYRNRQSSIPSPYVYTITGGTRTANSYSAVGSLSKITYKEGGSTILQYEPNDYYDNVTGQTIQGAGIRVAQITTNDNINPTNDMVTSYSYIDPTTGHSSGRAISLPIFAFTVPNSGSGTTSDLWNAGTALSYGDLSTEDHSVLYSAITKTQPGAGRTVSTYLVPAVNGDNNISSPLIWSPTFTNTGTATNLSNGFLINDKNTYPFPPNPNYDFLRGLPEFVMTYNSAGKEVGEIHYSYQPPESPIIVWGLKFDNNSYGENYAKYQINTSAGPLMNQIVNKTFDVSSNSTAFQTITTNYVYGSEQHKKLTKQSVVGSNGNIQTVNYVYTKDYNTSVANDVYTQAIRGLQQMNVNVPVENYTQVTQSGITKYTGGILIAFQNTQVSSSPNLILPLQTAKFISPDGVTDFQPATVINGIFTWDNRYYNQHENYLSYDYSGYLLSKDDNFHHLQTTIIDHYSYKPIADVSGATADEIAFSDFDSKTSNVSFSAPATIIPTGRSGESGLSLSSGVSLTKVVKIHPKAQNDIFSIWVQSGTSGQLQITLTDGIATKNGLINFDNTSSSPTGWRYYETKIPLNGFAATNVTCSFNSSQNIIIDDVLLYPDVAEVKTYSYDLGNYLKTSETNTNGVSKYFSYDQNGRLEYLYNQDKQIILKKTYVSQQAINAFSAPVIVIPANVYTGVQTLFSNSAMYYPCYGNATAITNWNFGDGTTGTGSYLTHTYAVAGTYTITVTVTSSLFGSKTTTQTITVLPHIVPVSVQNSTQGINTIVSLVFKQGNTTVYSFSASQLTSGHAQVAPGVYSIEVQVTGTLYNSSTGRGYGSLSYSDDNLNGGSCFNYQQLGTYSFDDDLTNKTFFKLSLQTGACN